MVIMVTTGKTINCFINSADPKPRNISIMFRKHRIGDNPTILYWQRQWDRSLAGWKGHTHYPRHSTSSWVSQLEEGMGMKLIIFHGPHSDTENFIGKVLHFQQWRRRFLGGCNLLFLLMLHTISWWMTLAAISLAAVIHSLTETV